MASMDKGKKLNWQEIKQLFDKQWVELVDYDWPEELPDPVSGVVRVHAKGRKEFDALVARQIPAHSAFVFVGKPDIGENEIFNTFHSTALRK